MEKIVGVQKENEMDENVIREQLDVIRHATDVIEGQLTPPNGNVIPVNPGDNLASIIEQAPAGAIIAISNDYITAADLIFSKPVSLVAQNPLPSGRIDLKAHVPIINGTINFQNVSSVNITDINLTGANSAYNLLTLGDNCLILRCIVYGSPNGQHRGIWADGRKQKVQDSYIGNIWSDIDTQAIFCYNGCDGLDVINTYLEAASENFLAGGADADSVDKIPQNISFDNCDFFKPLEWKDKIAVKNLFELKCAKKVTLKNSRLTNCWASGQVGYGIVLTVRNQDGKAPFSVIEDFVMDNCVVSNVGAGYQILGEDYTNPSGKFSRGMYTNNKFQIDSSLGAGRQIYLQSGPVSQKFSNNQFTGDANINSFMYFSDPTKPCVNFEFDGNEAMEGAYGIFGESISPNLGVNALNAYAPGYVCNNNTLHKQAPPDRYIPYPSCISVV